MIDVWIFILPYLWYNSHSGFLWFKIMTLELSLLYAVLLARFIRYELYRINWQVYLQCLRTGDAVIRRSYPGDGF